MEVTISGNFHKSNTLLSFQSVRLVSVRWPLVGCQLSSPEILTRTGPAGHSGQRSCISRGNLWIRNQMVQLIQISNFAVHPHVWLTFLWGNIGVPRTNDSANERYCLCQSNSGVRYIGCGGPAASNRAPKRRANVIILYPESTLSGDQVMSIPRS